MLLRRRIKRSEFIELSTLVDDLDRKMKVLELDLDLFVKKLKASKGLTKVKEEEKETKDLKPQVLLNPDGTIP